MQEAPDFIEVGVMNKLRMWSNVEPQPSQTLYQLFESVALHKDPEEVRDRVNHALKTLQEMFRKPLCDVSGFTRLAGKPIAFIIWAMRRNWNEQSQEFLDYPFEEIHAASRPIEKNRLRAMYSNRLEEQDRDAETNLDLDLIERYALGMLDLKSADAVRALDLIQEEPVMFYLKEWIQKGLGKKAAN
jgi:hypothetical protein